MKKIIENKRTRAVIRRIISFAAALAMVLNCMSIGDFKGNIYDLSNDIRVAADAPVEIKTIQDLVNYSQNYSSANSEDLIRIELQDAAVHQEYTGFRSIGNADAPFSGVIEVITDYSLNLNSTLFDYIKDDVEIRGAYSLSLSRPSGSGEALFAKHIIHDESVTDAKGWNVKYTSFQSTGSVATYVNDHSGFIGEIGAGAKVKLDITNNNLGTSGSGVANIVSNSEQGNVGLLCGTMRSGSSLEINSLVYDSGYGTAVYYVTSTGGNAGGLVGEMESGSVLTIGSTVSNPQSNAQAISTTADSSYAGGIVGKCEGTIDLQTASYTVSQHISGTSGAGGIAGFFASSENIEISTGKYIISSDCRVNGTGSCGGLFGMVKKVYGDMTITGAGMATYHSSGAAAEFGGLIGKYTTVDDSVENAAGNISNALNIRTTSAVATNRNGGTVSQFGGIVGMVEGEAYVLFEDVIVTTSNASANTNFGGLIGKAQKAFIELNGTNTISYSGVANDKTLGGVVGDLANGVLYLNGTTDLSGASGGLNSNAGQIVGYRESGLVFAANGWTLTRSAAGQTIDDVGSWGEVVRFNDSDFAQGNVLTINSDDGHYVTLLVAAPANMSNKVDFAKTALNIQHQDGFTTDGVLRGTCASLLTGDLSFASGATIDLRGTGLTGLTRDNGTNDPFIGTFNGNGGSITLAIGENYGNGVSGTANTVGNGTICTHKYNGLFARTNDATIKGLTITADSIINTNASTDGMLVGNLVALADGLLTLDGITVSSTINHAGGSAGYHIGGFVGKGTGNISIGTDSACLFAGTITGDSNNDDATIGGIIGYIGNSDDFSINVNKTTLSGSIISSGSRDYHRIGGLIGAILASSKDKDTDRNITVTGLTINGLTVNGAGNSGGLLGYEWYDTHVDFKNLDVTSGTVVSGGDTAGLVHSATGYWQVESGGIEITSITVNAAAAESFGMLVNKGYYRKDNSIKSAIYLELASNAYTLPSSPSLTLTAVTVFDELAAYTTDGDVTKNGCGVVSIATDASHSLLKMGTTGSADTYQNQTDFTTKNNPHSRYYYNLDAYRSSPASGAQTLLMWSVYQYAHKSIQHNFYYTGMSDTLSGSFDMAGYSYYPIDLNGNLDISGTLKLYNSEFDTAEGSTTDKRKSNVQAQHYTMQNSLLRNVSGAFTVDLIALSGNINKIGDYCGALVMGTVSSSNSGKPATVNVNGLVLGGIKIGSAAGPLLINKAGSNATLNITNVSNDATSYTSIGAGSTATNKYIATSLLGDIGTADSRAVKLTFSKIKLDGRKNSTAVTALPDLTTVYHSQGSLFSQATLVNKLSYADNSGSGGTYNYTYEEDWGDSTKTRTTAPGTVTYGHEVQDSAENRGKQDCYNGSWVPAIYTDPKTNPANTPYQDFTKYFQRYVYTQYAAADKTHELSVNIKAATFGGCGTYNDPYIITDGDQLNSIANIINGLNADLSFEISLPKDVGDDQNVSWCNGEHYDFKGYNGSVWYTGTSTELEETLSNDALRKYLAGAYYKIENDLTNEDTSATNGRPIPYNFQGISNSISSEYAFRGVIEGGGKTIKNNSKSPLIVSSNGCVVKNLTISVTPKSDNSGTDGKIKITQNSSTSFEYGNNSAQAYGAVIAKIFGGDNIIERVKVIFGDSPVIEKTNGAGKAYLVPIGGYVGVIKNGGLIFRGMSGRAEDNEAGLSAANLSGFEAGVGDHSADPTASDNTRWLYVNPIIGRVLNGYAITESSSYKPFENGIREYPDGSKVVYNGSDFVTVKAGETYSGNTVGVTMHNGTKNYSIADIDTGASKFAMKDSNGKTNGEEGSTVTVSNAQSLFIISLITESGLATSSNCKYDNTNNLLKPYDNYMATHLADYTKIGQSNLQISDEDYQKAASDIQYATDLSTKVPYLIKTYTPVISGSPDTYPAFNLAAFDGGKDEHYLKMTFSNASGSDEIYYLPDGFRGLGALLLQNGASTNWANSSTNNDSKTRIFNAMFLTELTGNSRNVSLNMNLLLYSDDNYSTPSATQGYLKTGFGFFNALRSKEGSATSNKLKDLTLSGSVKYDLVTSDGNSIPYSSAYLDKSNNARPATGGFIGAPGVDTNNDGGGGDMWLENIKLYNLSVTGVEAAGGFMGCSNAAKSYTFKKCTADELEVVGGTSVGGMIGYIRNGSSKIKALFDGEEFGIISIRARASWNGHNDNGNTAVGSLFGDNYANNTNGVTVENVTIRNAKSTEKGYVGYDKTLNNLTYPRAGGVFGGAFRNSAMTMANVTVKNIDIEGGKAGGMIGYCNGSYQVTVTDCHVETDKDCRINNTFTGNDQGGSGGIVGYYEKTAAITVSDSDISGYTVSGQRNCGGIIGRKLNACDLICKNLTVSNVTAKSNQKLGSMVGDLNGGSLKGYNILINDQKFERFSGSAAFQYKGYIVGNNNSIPIKLAGFSRQGTIDTDKMVGNSSSASSENYGGGYVVFADYRNASNKSLGEGDDITYPGRNEKFSNIKTNDNKNVGDNAAPYVTTSPKLDISETTDGDDTVEQWLTGDGASGTNYYDSAIRDIATPLLSTNSTDAKRYQHTGIVNVSMINDKLKNKIVPFSQAVTFKENGELYQYTGKNFAVLVVDDINPTTTTALINNYLQLLTNTDKNFALDEDGVYTTSITSWRYDHSANDFKKNTNFAEYSDKSPALRKREGQFYINSTELDNPYAQFSLIDVQFFDPSDTAPSKKVAYHLYVPVVVKKMLYYSLEFEPASGTTYDLLKYPTSTRNLIENLGNPFTVKVTYRYLQSASEWTEAINNGEDVCRNYNKKISVTTSGTGTFPSDAKIVLVDPNGDLDRSYTGSLKVKDNDDGVLALVGSQYMLDLSAFSGFEPVALNDMMTVTATKDNTQGNLVQCAQEEASVIAKLGDDNIPLRLKTTDDPETEQTYSVEVTLNGNYITEDYYLSIFTKEDPLVYNNDVLQSGDSNIYHWVMGADNNLNDEDHPTARNGNQASHLLIGNLYENTVTIAESRDVNRIMSADNNTLKAELTANIGFTQNAIDARIVDLINNENVSIYQTFMVALNKTEDSSSTKGILAYPVASATSYTVDGVQPSDLNFDPAEKTRTHIAFPNNENIKSYLITAASSGSADRTVTIKSDIEMTYTSEQLAAQFPQNAEGNGTIMIGYSNISSSSQTASASHASANTENQTGSHRVLYVVDSIKTVALSYRATTNPEFTNDGNGNFGQLGINARELDGDYIPMNTIASYDASEYSMASKANYVKIEMTLAKKSKYDTPSSADPYLPINNYLSAFEIKDINRTAITDATSESYQENGETKTRNASVDKSTQKYTYIIPKNCLDTASDNVYLLPIDFTVISGTAFEQAGLEYSNYRVNITVSMLETPTSEALPNSRAESFIVYTNAKIISDIVTPH